MTALGFLGRLWFRIFNAFRLTRCECCRSITREAGLTDWGLSLCPACDRAERIAQISEGGYGEDCPSILLASVDVEKVIGA